MSSAAYAIDFDIFLTMALFMAMFMELYMGFVTANLIIIKYKIYLSSDLAQYDQQQMMLLMLPSRKLQYELFLSTTLTRSTLFLQ